MRKFLHKLMVDITRHPREIITPEWSKENWTHNVFRLYELLFGRRAGARFESGASVDEYEITTHVFGTWESLIAHAEGMVRLAFKRRLTFKVVPLPQLALANGQTMNSSPFRFAIAYDNALDWTTQSTLNTLTVTNFTVTGSNNLLMAVNWGNGTSGTWTSTTYNSVSMTGSSVDSTVGHALGSYLPAPSTGTHDAIMTFSANFASGFAVVNYTGASQTGIDAYTTNCTASLGATIVDTITTATANCWMVMFYQGSNNTPAASTNATGRLVANSGGSLASVFDSNGTISTGGFSMTVTTNNAGQQGISLAYSFAQVAGATVNSGFFFAVSR